MPALREDPFAFVPAFVATAEAKSFRVAARELGVTPSSISKSISKLEEELGVTLLRRTSRFVTTTDEGEAFLRRCKIALDEMRAARADAIDARSAPRGKLRVSLPPALAQLLVVPALHRLLTRHPGLDIELVCTDRFVSMEAEAIDAALRIGKIEESGAIIRRLPPLRWSTVASPDYLARRGTPTSIADLATHDLLGFVLPNGKRQSFRFHDGNESKVVEARGGIVGDDGVTLVRAAKAGLGIVQAHDYMTAELVARRELIELLPRLAAPGPAVSVLTSRAAASSHNARAFVDFAVTLFLPGGR